MQEDANPDTAPTRLSIWYRHVYEASNNHFWYLAGGVFLMG